MSEWCDCWLSIIEWAAILVSWCERNWGEYKMPVGRGAGEPPYPMLLTPSPLPTGILYSPQFRSHQETKMAARRTQRSTSTMSQKNRGLWTLYSQRRFLWLTMKLNWLKSVFEKNCWWLIYCPVSHNFYKSRQISLTATVKISFKIFPLCSFNLYPIYFLTIQLI